MNAIVNFRLCTLSDEDLVKKVDEMTDKMYKTNSIPLRTIPAQPDKNYDLLVGELCVRFIEQIQKRQ